MLTRGFAYATDEGQTQHPSDVPGSAAEPSPHTGAHEEPHHEQDESSGIAGQTPTDTVTTPGMLTCRQQACLQPVHLLFRSWLMAAHDRFRHQPGQLPRQKISCAFAQSATCYLQKLTCFWHVLDGMQQ